MDRQTQTATFAAGCFWHVETVFRRLPGVLRTSVGFMGGRTARPTYDAVAIGNTGHAEVVQLVFAADQISYDNLLACFWTIHDPTTWAKPNPLVASPYRSAIFYHSAEQAGQAERSKKARQARHNNAIATEILPAGPYTPADRLHQRFEEKRTLRAPQPL